MEKFSFFNDIDDDRVYFAEDFARHLAKYFTNGIFNNELQVIANNDMTITIKEGDANIEGYRYTNTGDLTKTIDTADGALKRIDNVVIRLDLTNRLISAQIIKGTFSDSPSAPSLVRNSTTYDLRIAKIIVPEGTTKITQDLIIDTRFLTSDCGNVVSTVQQLNTDDIFAQYNAEFNKWFNNVKDVLSSDAAGNLQSEIDSINNKISYDVLFPVGTILQNTSADFNPNTLYGGTWERIKGKVLVGVDEDDTDFASSGLTGGEKKHQLSVAELPKHRFIINQDGYCTNVSGGAGYTVPNCNSVGVQAPIYTNYIGEDKAHNNLQPYETVYIWKRVA